MREDVGRDPTQLTLMISKLFSMILDSYGGSIIKVGTIKILRMFFNDYENRRQLTLLCVHFYL